MQKIRETNSSLRRKRKTQETEWRRRNWQDRNQSTMMQKTTTIGIAWTITTETRIVLASFFPMKDWGSQVGRPSISTIDLWLLWIPLAVGALRRNSSALADLCIFLENNGVFSFGLHVRLFDYELMRMEAEERTELSHWWGMMVGERTDLYDFFWLNYELEFRKHCKIKFNKFYEG